jgi:predicted PurR-regulated permease PerM
LDGVFLLFYSGRGLPIEKPEWKRLCYDPPPEDRPEATGSAMNKNIYQPIMFTLALLGLTWIAILVRDSIFLIIFSCMMASALHPLVTWSKRMNCPPRLSILTLYLLFILFLAYLFYSLGGIIVDEAKSFALHLPQYTDSVHHFLKQYSVDGNLINNTAHPFPSENLISQLVSGLLSNFSQLTRFFEGLLSALSLLVLTFFLITDTQSIESSVLNAFPMAKKVVIRQFLGNLASQMGIYIRGQVFVMSLMGLLIWAGLSILGVKYALFLGFIAFLLSIIPILGALLGSGVGIFIAFGQSPMLALWAGLVYFVAHLVESNFLAPLILGKAISLHPFWILCSLLIGGTLYGIEGVLLAIPVAITIRLFGQEFLGGNVASHTG